MVYPSFIMLCGNGQGSPYFEYYGLALTLPDSIWQQNKNRLIFSFSYIPKINLEKLKMQIMWNKKWLPPLISWRIHNVLNQWQWGKHTARRAREMRFAFDNKGCHINDATNTALPEILPLVPKVNANPQTELSLYYIL